jgi:stage V sporulation protein D (sporulation-specific penicillin-binding protein)
VRQGSDTPGRDRRTPGPEKKPPGKPAQQAYRARLRGVVLASLALVLLLSLRLFYLQGIAAAALAERAASNRVSTKPLPAERGQIVDRRGTILATNVPTGSIAADPAAFLSEPDKEGAVQKLAPLLGRPAAEVMADLTRPNTKFVWLARKLPWDVTEQIMALKIDGITRYEDARRSYPEGQLAAQVLGYVDLDHRGREGVEAAFDERLTGTPGAFTAEFTPDGRLIAGSATALVPPQPGLTLQLTIDARLQRLAEEVLAKALKEKGAKRGLIAVEDPRTGEILTLAMAPSFDPNTYLHLTADYDSIRNWSVADAMDPGSIFKPITAAMALEEKVVTPDSQVDDPGYLVLPGHTITNFHPGNNGGLTVGEALAISSNVAMAKIALMVGADRFYDYLHLFNLDRITRFDTMPGYEVPGQLRAKEATTELDRALMGIGQSLSVTPIQILAAQSAIANDGVWIRPHLVKGWLKADGTPGPALPPEDRRQVISRWTAEQVRQGMELVLQGPGPRSRHWGTGTAARVPGYSVAGKTGTAEKYDRETGKVVKNKYLASFVGFVPASKPQVVVLVMLDEPTYQDGLSGYNSAPVFSEFMREAVRILEIPPDRPEEAGIKPVLPPVCKVPNLVGMGTVEATQAAHQANYRLKIVGDGPVITAQEIGPGQEVRCFADLTASAAGPAPPSPEPGVRVRVPDVWQMPLTQAAETLSAAGFRPEIPGSGLAVSQTPAAGTLAPKGAQVQVILAPPNY